MFEQTFVNTHARTRRPWTVAASLSLQTGLVALAVVLPMLHPEILHPLPDYPKTLYLPLRARPVPPVPATTQAASRVATPLRPVFVRPALMDPGKIPPHPVQIADTFADPGSVVGALPAGASGAGSPGGLLFGTGEHAMQPLPPQPVAKTANPPAPKGPVLVSTGVQAAKLLFGPKPTYPVLAKAAHMQGVVHLQAVIAIDGAIQNLQVTGGPPLLVRAALDAVGRWRYQPTLLNGSAVEVITEIDVSFTLGAP